jgi:predicted AAA+ superfamily ATPase
MFERTILNRLHAWKVREDRKPLILRGARQTGKTSVVNLFSTHFDRYIRLNLEKPEDKKLFERDVHFQEVIDAIFYSKSFVKNPGDTLIFIDEIQNSPKAVNLLRYFYEEAPDLYVIAACSLMESLLDKRISFPVGRVEYLAVRPCSFREFLLATNETRSLEILQQYPFPAYAHEQLQKLFKQYTLIGGMPEVVANYAHNHDLIRLRPVYDGLVVSYLDDVGKYARNSTLDKLLRHLIVHSFSSAAAPITYSGFGDSNYRSREVGEAFRILEKTMLLNLIFPVVNTRLPLHKKSRSPRLQLVDTGLVNFQTGIQRDVFDSVMIEDAWQGRVAEHIVGQELLTLEPSVLAELHYWEREDPNTQSEVDFIHIYRDLVIPVEVKSGTGGRLRSLHQFVDRSPHSYAIRIYSGMFKTESTRTIQGKKFTLISLPFYLTGQVNEILDQIIR